MIFLKLDNLEKAKELCKVCDSYKEQMYIDILYGRYTIDGCSMLGVASLLGNVVEIKPCTNDENLMKLFLADVEKIGAYNERQ